jgi:hypothetical protein
MPRPVPHGSALQKRLELLPEEAVYLIERGALLCWKESNISITDTPGMEDIHGSPMSVQQAYAEMIGREGLTLEHYQVNNSLYLLNDPLSRCLGVCVFEAFRLLCDPGPSSVIALPDPFSNHYQRLVSIGAVANHAVLLKDDDALLEHAFRPS